MQYQLFLDMDGVLCDFNASPFFKDKEMCQKGRGPSEMFEQGFFESLPPVKGSLWAVREILKMEVFDVNILTQPMRETSYSYSEKACWVKKWIPELANKITMTQNKELLSGEGRFLIDDSSKKWQSKWESKGGTFLFMNYEEGLCHQMEWDKILSDLRKMTYSGESI